MKINRNSESGGIGTDLVAIFFGFLVVMVWLCAVLAALATPFVIIWAVIKLVAHFTALILLC